MADKKISQLTTLAQADVAVTADFLPIVDTSATETKKATPQALVQAGATGATLPVALGAVGTPSYTFTGDLNTGLWSPAADTLAASTGGSERMRLDSSGNLGLGTTAGAGQRFVIRTAAQTDAALVADNGVNTGFKVQFAANLTSIGNDFNNPLGFLTNNTERMRLDASGNLGIGTTSPSEALEISRTTDPKIRFVDVGNLDAKIGIVGSTSLGFEVNGSERMRLDSSGNLGIGTASPGARLHVAGESRFGLGAEAVRAAIGSAFAAGQGELFTASTNSMGVGTAGAANLNFYSNSVLRMIIDSNGNVRTNTGALTTTATDGFLYVPTCAGTPTGTPTAITGMAPIVVNTTNNKLYFYSGGAWRDAGP